MIVALRTRDAPDGSHYWSLTPGQAYEVLGIEGDLLRLLDDTGDPYLFDPACFDWVDRTEPDHWQTSHGTEGERYSCPPAWDGVGFFEKYHDDDPEVRKAFWDQLPAFYPDTDRRWNARSNP